MVLGYMPPDAPALLPERLLLLLTASLAWRSQPPLFSAVSRWRRTDRAWPVQVDPHTQRRTPTRTQSPNMWTPHGDAHGQSHSMPQPNSSSRPLAHTLTNLQLNMRKRRIMHRHKQAVVHRHNKREGNVRGVWLARRTSWISMSLARTNACSQKAVASSSLPRSKLALAPRQYACVGE
jgi:hypothetical protein